ncbi:MAG TPA: hypothetical protein VNT58_03835, partial [Gaiellaceae bacterium]|nr:hypothetical protein [Gaiellaceae bacterium]
MSAFRLALLLALALAAAFLALPVVAIFLRVPPGELLAQRRCREDVDGVVAAIVASAAGGD